jgi:hypothetical protein
MDLERLEAGDERTFIDLVRRHHGVMVRVARSFVPELRSDAGGHIGQAVAAHSTKPATTATVAIKAKPNHVDVLLGDICAFLSVVLLLTSSSCGIAVSFFQLLEVIASTSMHRLLSIARAANATVTHRRGRTGPRRRDDERRLLDSQLGISRTHRPSRRDPPGSYMVLAVQQTAKGGTQVATSSYEENGCVSN